MLRADRNAATLAGLICAAAGIKNRSGALLTATDFDVYNRPDEPVSKEPTVEDFMRILGRKG